jgi:hypothetical protein
MDNHNLQLLFMPLTIQQIEQELILKQQETVQEDYTVKVEAVRPLYLGVVQVVDQYLLQEILQVVVPVVVEVEMEMGQVEMVVQESMKFTTKNDKIMS